MNEINLKYSEEIDIAANPVIIKETQNIKVSPARKPSSQNDEMSRLTLKNTHTVEDTFDHTGKVIISKIENVYLTIKEEHIPKYYSSLNILVFLISLFSSIYMWMFLTMAGPMKNNYYCFDPFSKEFRLCNQAELCDNSKYGPSYVIFTKNEKIVNQTILQEIYNINSQYLDFFLKDSLLFSILNTKNDMFKEMSVFYNIVFAVTYNEEWNFFNFFHQYCNRSILYFQIILIILLGTVVGNYLLGYLADVLGRKPVIVVCGVIQFIGALIVFFSSQMMTKIENTDLSQSSIDGKFNFSLNQTYSGIPEFYNAYNLTGFESIGMNDFYSQRFTNIMKDLITSQIVQYNFSKYKFIFYVGVLFLFSPISGLSNVILAYVLENSLNDRKVFLNYTRLKYSIPSAYLLHFILFQFSKNFHFPMLICGICNLIIAISFAVFMHESPRYHYEFFEYEKITNFFSTVFDPKLLKEFYQDIGVRSTDSVSEQKNKKRMKNEILKGKSNINCLNVICSNIMFLGFKNTTSKYRKILQEERNIEIFRHDLLKNPFFLPQIMFANKHIKRNLWILLALTANIGIIYYLTLSKFNLTLVYSRSFLYNNLFINSNIFWLSFTMVLAIFCFDFLLKFFGFSVVLYVSFPFIFIFSLIYELMSLGDRSPEDMNTYYYNSIELIYDKRGSSLLAMLYIVTFFTTGIFCALFFYLTKLTKTLYRCTFYGMFRTLLDITIFFSIALSQYFEKSFFYVSVLSVIGFVNTYFIQEDFEFYIVDDLRVLELKDA